MALTGADLEEALRARLGAADFSAAAVRAGELLARRHTCAAPQLPVYSLTKTFIAALVLLAVQDGRLALEAPIARFRTDVPEGHRISLEQLLRHTAGLPDYGALPAYRRAVAAREAPWSFDRFAAATYRQGLIYPPSQGWSYANPGYALLVAVLEQVWEAPFAAQVRDRICGPLGLEQTRVADSLDDPRICAARSRSLDPDGTALDVTAHYHPGWVWHRLIVSDAADSARFLDAVLTGRWLGAALTGRMTSLVPVPGSHPPWTAPGYGLGLMGEADGPRGPTYGHDGGGPGYSTSAYHFTESAVSVAVLAATEDAAAVLAAAFALHDLATSRGAAP